MRFRAAVTVACGRSYVEFFGEARADGRLVLFEHFPDGFEL